MLVLYVLGCREEKQVNSIQDEDTPLPESQAAVTVEGILLGQLETGYAWFSFADPAPAEADGLLPDGCRTGWERESWYDENVVYGYSGDTQLDAGEITLRIGGYIPVDDNPTSLYGRPPAGEAVWFEASGGSEFPGFVVPELVAIPDPPEDVSFSFSEARFDWIPAPDGTSVEITVRDEQRRTLICRVEDDGTFTAPALDLEEMGVGEIVSASFSREYLSMVVDGDVLVRGIARQTILFQL